MTDVRKEITETLRRCFMASEEQCKLAATAVLADLKSAGITGFIDRNRGYAGNSNEASGAGRSSLGGGAGGGAGGAYYSADFGAGGGGGGAGGASHGR